MAIDELPYDRGYVGWESTVTTMAIAASNRATEFHAYVEKAKECTKYIGKLYKERTKNVQRMYKVHTWTTEQSRSPEH